MERRSFLVRFVAGVFLAGWPLARAKKRGTQLRPVNPEAELAKKLGYSADVMTVDAKKYPQLRTLRAREKQRCDRCALYSKLSRPDGWGLCSLFPRQRVPGAAWCNAWMQK